MKKVLSILFLMSSLFIFAQDSGDDFFSDDVNFDDMNFDDMFGEEGDDSFIEVVEDKSDETAEASAELLTTSGVEFGGSFSASITAGVSYSDFPAINKLGEDYTESFSPSLSASLHFNARPTDDTRFFGKVSTDIPFYQSADVYLKNDNFDPDTTEDYTANERGVFTEVQIPKIVIEELFSDFNYDNKLFFRVGKQNAKWGVGYFFSPADFLSLESIDPEDPTADREGPIAIKMNMPFGLNNLYTYITVPDSVFDGEAASVSDLIIAPMFQILLGETEVSTGIYYQKDSSPRAMVSATYGTNSNLGQFSYFGEAVGLYGSDKTFVYEDSGILKAKTYDEKFFFNGTVGFMWNKEIKDNNFSLAAQYFYNGEGYVGSDAGIVNDTMILYFSGPDNALFDSLTLSDLGNRSQHYLGASFGITNLFDNEDLSISAFTMINLAQVSGYVKPSISYTFFDGLSTSIGATFNISDSGEEFFGDRIAFDLTFNLGGGNF